MKLREINSKSKNPTVNIGDDKREKMLKNIRNSGVVAAVILIGLGLLDIVLALRGYNTPNNLKYVEGLLFLFLLISILVDSHRIKKFSLEPKDEFEILADAKAKARAFNFLSTGILFVIIFFSSGNRYLLPTLYILLGMSWLIQLEIMKPRNAKRST